MNAALDHVREKSLTMQKTSDFEGTLLEAFNQMQLLGLNSHSIAISIFDVPKKEIVEHAFLDKEGERTLSSATYPYKDLPLFNRLWQSFDERVPLLRYELAGTEKQEFLEWVEGIPNSAGVYSDVLKAPSAFFSFAFMKHGALFTVQDTQPDQETEEILMAFARAIQPAYTRFDDLNRAEESSREAHSQASLNRIRAEIITMRHADDLQRITPLFWHELSSLGVPFFRCGIFIMNDETAYSHAFLSTPEGKPLADLNLPYLGAEITTRVVEYWHNKEIYTEYWDKKTFSDWIQSLIDQGHLKSTNEYLPNTQAPECLYLHFIPFLQGMLYVGSHNPLTPTETNLVQSLADTYAIAYARYEDFAQVAYAEQKLEAALVELKTTQAQLIQAEKMASLGELTAGIAHEIQNPLNFVNNYSEVNVELLEELEEEIENGDMEEAKAIIQDLIENEKKTHYHGKRADSIVKGMLQHSRRNTSTKELTDINALTDEYLRLSYHGLRAKDSSFNADFCLDFDANLPKIEVAASDLGRVILNIINNSFYAVNEKRKNGIEGYKPMVTLITKKKNGSVEIHIKDNGIGIPDTIKEKIFQPFFTTKPTGQGTGLGLSLSYDIIKAHGGELTVESKSGQMTEFIIELPVVAGK